MLLLPASEARRRVFRIDYTATPAQALIDASPARFKILRAGRKFGKTTYGRKKALDWIGPPGSDVWYIGPTYKQTKLIVWEDFKKLIPNDALAKKPNETDLIFTFKNASKLYLMGGDEPDSLRGPEPNGVILEEAAQHKANLWPEIIRPNLTPKKAPALFISTPKGFNWFKDLEDEANIRVMNGDPTWATFHYTIYDNPYIEREEIEEARKDCDNEAVWRQEYLAEYESSVGRVFSTFSDARHVRKILLPHGRFQAYRAIDWGQRDDTAGLWAFIQNRVLYVYREHLENNLPPSAQARLIASRTEHNEDVVDNIIGHDAARQDPEMKGLTVKWHFQNNGIMPLRHSSKDKKSSRSMINQLLLENRLVIDAENCRTLRKQMLAYEWKDTTLEKTEDGNDDAVDALHYLVEMLQFQLFMDRAPENKMSMDDIYEAIRREKEEMAHPKFKVPGRESVSGEMNVENTPAGYL